MMLNSEFMVRSMHKVQPIYEDYAWRHGMQIPKFLPCKYASIQFQGKFKKGEKEKEENKEGGGGEGEEMEKDFLSIYNVDEVF